MVQRPRTRLTQIRIVFVRAFTVGAAVGATVAWVVVGATVVVVVVVVAVLGAVVVGIAVVVVVGMGAAAPKRIVARFLTRRGPISMTGNTRSG